MTSVVLSQIEIPALIDLIVARVTEEIRKQPPPPPPPSQSETQRIYGDDALSKYIGVSVLTIRKMKSKLPRYRTGRKYYYLTNEIDDFFRVNVPKRFQPKVKQG